MVKERVTQEIYARLEEKGYRGRIVSARHIEELRTDIKRFRQKGLFDQEFYQEYRSYFEFDPSEASQEIKSLIVVAVPQPQTRVDFNWHGNVVSLLIPPTYLFEKKTDKGIEDVLAGILSPIGCKVVRARLPSKLLAVRSGLAKYGKNNISYVSGMGSFHRLVSFYSNLPCEKDNWHEIQMLERCETCSACLVKCPTGAINTERFLLRAERCITYLNEKPGNVPFPSWLDPSWHNCLVGCLYCQRVCPENKEFINWIDKGAEFSEEETTILLKRMPINQLPASLLQKLRKYSLVDYMDVIPRNLGVFLRPGDQSCM
ncbi:MAG: 4Fe-4S double cluster binding domain-containing protein [Promethearchaeota archaeon]